MISSTKLKSVDFYRSLRSLSLSLHFVFTPCLCFSNTHFCDMSCTSTLLFLIMFCLRFFFEMLLLISSLSSCQNFVIGVGGICKSASGIFVFIGFFVFLLFNLEGEVVEWWFVRGFYGLVFFLFRQMIYIYFFLFLAVVTFAELFQIKIICNLIACLEVM